MNRDLPISDTNSCGVPVFDCHVIVSGPDDAGVLHGRVSNLPEIQASARDERHLLQILVKAFKATLIRAQAEGKTISWSERSPLEPGERQRWIPVHL
ncbi:MAG: hypothetical protein KDA80_20640 [Planctomycetaceae bacterium]|nr:hypothetical protein [Planctomycetaceae bacterium]